MTLGLKTFLTIMVAALLISSGLFAAASTQKDKSWGKKADDSFYLSPGLAEKLLTQAQWDRYDQKMKKLPPDQLSSFRVDMHKMLMQEARDRHLEVPPVSPEHGKRVQESSSGVSYKGFDPGRNARLLLVAAGGAGAGVAGNAGMGAGTTGGNTISNGTMSGTGASQGQFGTNGSQAPGAMGDFGNVPEAGSQGRIGGDEGMENLGGGFAPTTPQTPGAANGPATPGGNQMGNGSNQFDDRVF
jgi:hypothetical protein